MYHYMYPSLWRAGVPESALLTNYSLLPRTLSVENFFQIQLIGNLCVTPVCICNTFDWNKYSMFPCSLTVGSLLSLLDRRSYCWIAVLTVGSPLSLLDPCSYCWIPALTVGSLTVGSLLSLLDPCSHCWIAAVTVGSLTVGSLLSLLDRRSYCWIPALTVGSQLSLLDPCFSLFLPWWWF